MSQNLHLHLRTLRRKAGLTQADLASLLPKGCRNRVSRIELGLQPLNASEIIAYGLIFGPLATRLFQPLRADTVEIVMQRAYRFHRKLEHDPSPKAQRKRQVTERMLARAVGKKAKPKTV